MKILQNSFYVNYGEYTIRHIEKIIGKNVYWFSYDLRDGYPLHPGQCQIKRLQQWGKREATKIEIEKLQLREPPERGIAHSYIIIEI
jgi:hypothetical protein